MEIKEILKDITVHEIELPEGLYYVISKKNLQKLVDLCIADSEQ